MKICVADEAGKAADARKIQTCFKSFRTIAIERRRKNDSCLEKVRDLRLVLDAAKVIVGVEPDIVAKLLLQTKVKLRLAARSNRRERRAASFTRRTKGARTRG